MDQNRARGLRELLSPMQGNYQEGRRVPCTSAARVSNPQLNAGASCFVTGYPDSHSRSREQLSYPVPGFMNHNQAGIQGIDSLSSIDLRNVSPYSISMQSEQKMDKEPNSKYVFVTPQHTSSFDSVGMFAGVSTEPTWERGVSYTQVPQAYSVQSSPQVSTIQRLVHTSFKSPQIPQMSILREPQPQAEATNSPNIALTGKEYQQDIQKPHKQQIHMINDIARLPPDFRKKNHALNMQMCPPQSQEQLRGYARRPYIHPSHEQSLMGDMVYSEQKLDFQQCSIYPQQFLNPQCVHPSLQERQIDQMPQSYDQHYTSEKLSTQKIVQQQMQQGVPSRLYLTSPAHQEKIHNASPALQEFPKASPRQTANARRGPSASPRDVQQSAERPQKSQKGAAALTQASPYAQMQDKLSSKSQSRVKAACNTTASPTGIAKQQERFQIYSDDINKSIKDYSDARVQLMNIMYSLGRRDITDEGKAKLMAMKAEYECLIQRTYAQITAGRAFMQQQGAKGKQEVFSTVQSHPQQRLPPKPKQMLQQHVHQPDQQQCLQPQKFEPGMDDLFRQQVLFGIYPEYQNAKSQQQQQQQKCTLSPRVGIQRETATNSPLTYKMAPVPKETLASIQGSEASIDCAQTSAKGVHEASQIEQKSDHIVNRTKQLENDPYIPPSVPSSRIKDSLWWNSLKCLQCANQPWVGSSLQRQDCPDVQEYPSKLHMYQVDLEANTPVRETFQSQNASNPSLYQQPQGLCWNQQHVPQHMNLNEFHNLMYVPQPRMKGFYHPQAQVQKVSSSSPKPQVRGERIPSNKQIPMPIMDVQGSSQVAPDAQFLLQDTSSGFYAYPFCVKVPQDVYQEQRPPTPQEKKHGNAQANTKDLSIWTNNRKRHMVNQNAPQVKTARQESRPSVSSAEHSRPLGTNFEAQKSGDEHSFDQNHGHIRVAKNDSGASIRQDIEFEQILDFNAPVIGDISQKDGHFLPCRPKADSTLVSSSDDIGAQEQPNSQKIPRVERPSHQNLESRMKLDRSTNKSGNLKVENEAKGTNSDTSPAP